MVVDLIYGSNVIVVCCQIIALHERLWPLFWWLTLLEKMRAVL